MSLARPPRPRVDPDPGVLAENRGHTANVAGTLGLHPELAAAFRTLAGFLVNEASTPRRQRELVILRTGWNCGAQYEFGQHLGQAGRTLVR
jgi:4-carboxymuconolactone decarboxylase